MEVNEEGCGVEVQGWGKGENLRRGEGTDFWKDKTDQLSF